MAENDVLINLDINTKEGQKNLALLEKETQEYAKEVKTLEQEIFLEKRKLRGLTTKEEKKATEERIKGLEKSKNEIKQVASDTASIMGQFNDEVDSSFDNLGTGLDDVAGSIGGLGAPLQMASGGVKALGSAFKTLLANPIFLVIAGLVGTLKLIYDAFKRTSGGADTLGVAFAYLEGLIYPIQEGLASLGNLIVAVFTEPKKYILEFADLIKENIINRFEGLMELIPALGKSISLLFEGEFAEAGKVAFDAVSKVATGVENMSEKIAGAVESVVEFGAKVNESANASANLVAQEQKLAKQLRENAVLNSEAIRQIEQLKNIRDNELLSIEERIEANEKINEIELERSKREEETAKLAVKLAQDRLKIEGETKENLQAVADAQVEYNQVLNDSAGIQAEYIANRQALLKESAEFARAEIEFELEKVNIVEKSEEKKLQAKIDALKKTAKLYGENTIEFKEFTKQVELAELELQQFRVDTAVETEQKIAEGVIETKKKSCSAEGGTWVDGVGCDFTEKEEAKKQQNIETAISTAEDIFNSVTNYMSALKNAEIQEEKQRDLEALDEKQKLELALIDQQLADGLISKEEAQRLEAESDKKFDAKREQVEKKAFEEKKKLDITLALINGAVAITQAFAQLGPIAGAIAAVGVGVSTGLQIDLIKRQKFEEGGVLEGPSHADGGIPFTIGGQAGFEAEGGEVLINKKSSQMFRKELSVINQAGGGVKFAEGGVLGDAKIEEEETNITEQLAELIAINKNPIRAVVSETEITDNQNRINNIQNRSEF